MKCSKCNYEIEDGSVFCECCGEKISHAANAQSFFEETAQGNHPTNRCNKKKGTLWISIAVTFVAIVIPIIFSCSNNSVAYEEPVCEEVEQVTMCEEVEQVTKPILSESERQALLNIGYVDLGLPSGTLWKDHNENGYFSYDEAISQFGYTLPSKDNMEELIKYCKWSWSGWCAHSQYYTVTGPNGNSIVFPMDGAVLVEDEERYGVGQSAYFWTTTHDILNLYREYYGEQRELEKDKIQVYNVSSEGLNKWRYSVRLAQ